MVYASDEGLTAIEPVWELRVGDLRVFYDVDTRAMQVIVRAVRRKGRSTTREIP